MALVVFLRGVNVGGHRTFRPTALARQLSHLDAVNIGAAGTFVVRQPITQANLRAEVVRRLPFDAEVAICKGEDIVRLTSHDHFGDQPAGRDVVRFVSVMTGRSRLTPVVPMTLPSAGDWLLKILARENRFLIGLYRRRMRAISYLGQLDRIFGVPVTTRNWSTMMSIASLLGGGAR